MPFVRPEDDTGLLGPFLACSISVWPVSKSDLDGGRAWRGGDAAKNPGDGERGFCCGENASGLSFDLVERPSLTVLKVDDFFKPEGEGRPNGSGCVLWRRRPITVPKRFRPLSPRFFSS